MPRLSLYTNAPASQISMSALLGGLTTVAARSIGKDEKSFMVLVHADTPMKFAGSEERCAFLEISSIGYIGGDKNKDISDQMSFVCASHLDIPRERVYINFFDVKPADWGFKGSTSAALTKEQDKAFS